MASELG